MRRRSRHDSTTRAPYEAPATNSRERRRVDASDTSREALDNTLRAFARLLAQQAARETFERDRAGDVNPEEPA
jgi:hypothetical protein